MEAGTALVRRRHAGGARHAPEPAGHHGTVCGPDDAAQLRSGTGGHWLVALSGLARCLAPSPAALAPGGRAGTPQPTSPGKAPDPLAADSAMIAGFGAEAIEGVLRIGRSAIARRAGADDKIECELREPCAPLQGGDRVKILKPLAKLFAVFAGVLLTVITLMTCVSLIGRNTVGWSIVGAFELSGAAAGAAIAMFMPWCQVRRGNIIVDFFTAGASAATQDRLDRLGALILALAMGLLAWRTAIGGINAWNSQTGSMIMGFPEWIVYTGMVPPLALTALIAAVQAICGFDTRAAA